jgi:predicted XRE-type DNA-binding protein
MKRGRKNKATHITTGNVFEDLGFDKSESALLAYRTDLHETILQLIRDAGHSPRDLERILDEPQPRISELLNGKISKMSVDKLLKYFFRLGAKSKEAKKILLRAAEG